MLGWEQGHVIRVIRVCDRGVGDVLAKVMGIA